MADKLISGLPEATSIAGNDLLVTEQTSIAKKITADNLLQSLATMWTAHGGVESFDLVSTSGLSKTYRMTYADESYTDITITDGTGITDIVTTTSGLTHTITISLNNGTTKVFTVDDGVGISSISAPSSVGLEDTYTINLSDGTTSTFTVTNGASVSSITLNGTTITFTKDDGNSIDLSVPTLRIRYSVTQPDDDNDIITTPSNWMGVAWALDSAVLHYTDYSWFKIKGETGDNAEVSTYQRKYKYSDDGTQYPTPISEYYSTIAAAYSAVGGDIQGKYLWIATTITWNNGTPTVIYTSSYQGVDGKGLSGVVKSLYMSDTSTSLAPDTNGQVTVSSADMGAIKAPATASDGQVLTWDATDQVWYAGSVSTGTVNSVNSQLPDAGGNVTIYGTNVAMSSTDSTTVKAAIDAKPDDLSDLGITASATELNYTDGVTSNIQDQLDAKADSSDLSDYLPLSGGTMSGAIQGGTVSYNGPSPFIKEHFVLAPSQTEIYRDIFQGIDENGNRVFTFRGYHTPTYNSIQIGVHNLSNGAPGGISIRRNSDNSFNIALPEKPSSSLDNLEIPSTSWVRDLVQYRSGATINLGSQSFAGFFTSSTVICFFIPLPKNLDAITSASLSVDTSWAVRHPSGSFLINSTSLASFGTVECSVLSTGVRIKVTASSAKSLTNNVPVSVLANTATLRLT